MECGYPRSIIFFIKEEIEMSLKEIEKAYGIKNAQEPGSIYDAITRNVDKSLSFKLPPKAAFGSCIIAIKHGSNEIYAERLHLFLEALRSLVQIDGFGFTMITLTSNARLKYWACFFNAVTYMIKNYPRALKNKETIFDIYTHLFLTPGFYKKHKSVYAKALGYTNPEAFTKYISMLLTENKLGKFFSGEIHVTLNKTESHPEFTCLLRIPQLSEPLQLAGARRAAAEQEAIAEGVEIDEDDDDELRQLEINVDESVIPFINGDTQEAMEVKLVLQSIAENFQLFGIFDFCNQEKMYINFRNYPVPVQTYVIDGKDVIITIHKTGLSGQILLKHAW
jgi:hypothetical protein